MAHSKYGQTPAVGSVAKRPFVTKDQLDAIIARYPTPLHLYSEKLIRSRMRALAQAFAWNPGFKEYFAVKATPNPEIVSVLVEEGCGCDCATAPELMLADAVGVRGHDIMLSSNDTPLEDFLLANKLGALINFDSYELIDFWRTHVGAFPETVCVRINPGGSVAAQNTIIGNPQDSKFGMTKEQIKAAIRELSHEGVKHFGIHAFLASNTLGNDYYPDLAARLFHLVVELHAELGVDITFVDLSGGVGVAYDPSDEPADIMAIGQGVREAYERIIEPSGLTLSIKTELGRWLLAPAGALITRVIHTKHTYKDYLGVDACSADLIRPMMYGAYHHITVMGKEDAPGEKYYNVVGGLCENADQLAHDRLLPEVHVGDVLFIHDAGAHGHAMGFNYNGKLRSKEVLLTKDGSARLIRRAETARDLFATLDVTPLGKKLIDQCSAGTYA
ncbi:MAG: diaminopimelate decarboxylase family protein [Atopobiaceae bacterium]|jgi:diaminopimelate decarboxylase